VNLVNLVKVFRGVRDNICFVNWGKYYLFLGVEKGFTRFTRFTKAILVNIYCEYGTAIGHYCNRYCKFSEQVNLRGRVCGFWKFIYLAR
jgi:hypothetical protein